MLLVVFQMFVCKYEKAVPIYKNFTEKKEQNELSQPDLCSKTVKSNYNFESLTYGLT